MAFVTLVMMDKFFSLGQEKVVKGVTARFEEFLKAHPMPGGVSSGN
jgi:hypothetical protein